MLELKGEVQDPRFTPLHPRPEIRHALSVPMLAGNDFIGVLNVDVTRPRRPFTLRDAKALSILAGLGASALENAQLLDQTRESEARYRTLVEHASDGIFIADALGRYIDVNSSGCAMLGYSREEIQGMRLNDLIPPEDLATSPPRLEELRAGKTNISERRLIRKDDSLLPVVPLFDDRGKFIGFQGVAHDITAQKRAEEVLSQSVLQEVQARRAKVIRELLIIFAHPSVILRAGLRIIATCSAYPSRQTSRRGG